MGLAARKKNLWPKTYPVNKKTGKPKFKKDKIPSQLKDGSYKTENRFIPFKTGQHHIFCAGNYSEIPEWMCGCESIRAEEKKKMDNKSRNGSPTFYSLLEEMAETHDKKSHDYASNSNPCGNYEFAGQLACMFSHSPQDAGFVGRLAEKIYRLANLEGSKKSPTNESIKDTERDIAVITALWMSNRRDRRSVNQRDTNPLEPIQVPHDKMDHELVGNKKTKVNWPERCSICNMAINLEERIKHAVVCHLAIYYRQANTLKYPDGVVFVIPPDTF